MCRRDQSGWWLLALLFLVLLFSARTIWAEPASSPPSPPSAQSTPPVSPLTISGWQSFDEAWTNLKTELTESESDSVRLLTLLQNLQTEANELQLSLLESTRLLQSSEQALDAERLTLAATISERNAALDMLKKSRALAGILGGIAAVSSLTLILSIVF